jgi:transcriptional regulator with XRE-family HTH domain
MIKVAAMSGLNKDQQLGFSNRLQELLLQKGKSVSPTELARDFNLRWRGIPVTANATRKWLTGQSVPTLDKLSVVAQLLNTNEDWLRWGDMSMNDRNTGRSSRQQNDEQSFTQDFKMLSASNKKVVNAVMEVLLKEQQSKSKIISLGSTKETMTGT